MCNIHSCVWTCCFSVSWHHTVHCSLFTVRSLYWLFPSYSLLVKPKSKCLDLTCPSFMLHWQKGCPYRSPVLGQHQLLAGLSSGEVSGSIVRPSPPLSSIFSKILLSSWRWYWTSVCVDSFSDTTQVCWQSDKKWTPERFLPETSSLQSGPSSAGSHSCWV